LIRHVVLATITGFSSHCVCSVVADKLRAQNPLISVPGRCFMNFFVNSSQLQAGHRRLLSVDWVDVLIRLAIVFFLGVLIYLAIDGKIYKPLIKAANNREWAEALLRPSVFWVVMAVLLLGFRTILWFGYRPFASATPEEAPFLTVIIPAYNEGEMVGQTIDSVAQADYPRDRLEIFVVDDGTK